jgi:ABC-type branched-subunit amino acid transport system ATPase component
MKPILSIQRLFKRFGGLVALRDIRFDINQGEIIGLIGPNGAGKTTLFNCVAGVERPTSGQIIFTDKDRSVSLGGKKPETITALGIARTFQNIRLFDNMTVLDNVKIGRHCRTRSLFFGAVLRHRAQQKEEKAIAESAHRFVEFVGLQSLGGEIASSMPYGHQRRLEIARALATGPRFLLLDEPAAGLNPQETQDLISFIRDIQERYHLTILVIEHNLRLVMGLCRHLTVLDHGLTIAAGSPADIQKNPAVIRAYLGSEP